MKHKIQTLIARGRTAEALELLAAHSDDAILLQSRLANLVRQNNLGLIDHGSYSISLNQINNSILSLTNETDFVEKESISHTASKQAKKSGQKSIFFSYSHKDKDLQQRLKVFLSPLRRSAKISVWSDEEIKAGDEWDAKIKDRLRSADIILLLVSADFLASDYIYEVELETAMQRHDEGSAIVVPIILKPCQWKDMQFGKLQALPAGAKPITDWPDRDAAFNNVAEGIRRLIG